MIVEQFLPAFHYGDAIGNSTLRFHQFLIQSGIQSRIIAMTIDECLLEKATFFKDYHESPHSIKILHFAIPSELTNFFKQTKGKKAIIYHNITPARFFVDFSSDLVRFTNEGRNHLKQLNDSFDIAIADSKYNAQELSKIGYRNVRIFPIMINLKEYEIPHSLPFYNLLCNERKNIVFVGRITPNKKIEDLIKTVFFYKKYLSPSIRLIVAGNSNTLPKYFYSLKDLVYRFYLTPDDVLFTGHLPFAELLSIYKLADVFISMSEHEGFCLPLIESCFFNVPVIAYAAGAVEEVLAGAGITVANKKFDSIAGLAERAIHDDELNLNLKNKAKIRIKKYATEADPQKLLHLISKL